MLFCRFRNFLRLLPWFAAVIVFLGSGLAIWKLPEDQALQRSKKLSKVTPEKLLELEDTSRENLLKIIQTFGGLGFLLTGYFAWKNLQTAEKNREIAEDKQVTERFSKAVELLAEDTKLEARLGGIYLLERIAKDSPEDHWTVMEVLTAYIREKSPVQDDQEQSFIGADIQAALMVIGRRNAKNDDLAARLNLSCSNLHAADLRKCNLGQADLSYANLQAANLSHANLQRADFSNANLSLAVLNGADLRGAKLDYADFSGGSLRKADLREANIRSAITEKTFFEDNPGLSERDKCELHEGGAKFEEFGESSTVIRSSS